jgi:ribosomal RNA-processing protein 9
MGYVETLFGHQDHILGLDALRGENCVSVGSRDKTLRYWKIADETQIVLRGGGRSRIREVLEGGLLGDDEGDDVNEDGTELESKGKGKAKEERQFIEGSLECVAMVDETTFLSGGDSGYVFCQPIRYFILTCTIFRSICLWSLHRKKPVFIEGVAHGFNETHSESEGIIRTPRWITALASLRYSNLFMSGMRSRIHSLFYFLAFN